MSQVAFHSHTAQQVPARWMLSFKGMEKSLEQCSVQRVKSEDKIPREVPFS